MITAWSTNPDTTKDRPYVFRACFLDDFQGPVLANFTSEEFKFNKAAVLYDVASDYPKGLAEFFKKAWEKKHGPGSVVAYESFTTKDTDFSSQLTKIINSGAEVLFTPQYYNEVPLIVQQAKQLGWKKPILGSDSWGSDELVKLCGKDCYGLLLQHALRCGRRQGRHQGVHRPLQGQVRLRPRRRGRPDLGCDRPHRPGHQERRRDHRRHQEGPRGRAQGAIAADQGLQGHHGRDELPGRSGDPIKCAVIVKINDKGEFEFYKSVCP